MIDYKIKYDLKNQVMVYGQELQNSDFEISF